MPKKIIRLSIIVLAIGIGIFVISILSYLFKMVLSVDITDRLSVMQVSVFYAIVLSLFTIGGIFISRPISEKIDLLLNKVEKRLIDMPAQVLLLNVVGLILGLVIAFLLTRLTDSINNEFIQIGVNILLYVTLGYLGLRIANKRKDEVSITSLFKKMSKKTTNESTESDLKIVDTSALIDGRILDICKAMFIQGNICVPSFILNELRRIADSEDTLKRNRARMGLDVLAQMQKLDQINVSIQNVPLKENTEIDEALLKMAKDLNASIITVDYNLNKYAHVQGVTILNINQLSNAVKPPAIPGEEMTLQIIKEGKDQKQGIAYLADGTMVVVEGGRSRINETVEVVVTSALQTAAGRMIFAKIKE